MKSISTKANCMLSQVMLSLSHKKQRTNYIDVEKQNQTNLKNPMEFKYEDVKLCGELCSAQLFDDFSTHLLIIFPCVCLLYS